MRNKGMETRIDTDFRAVIEACGSEDIRPGGTWLSSEMRSAYQRLHQLGYAHSVETWQNGRLFGGLYGVAIGGIFFGESMFSVERDASKIALRTLCDCLIAYGFRLIDCQMATSHLMSLGAKLMPRAELVSLLARHATVEVSAQRWGRSSRVEPEHSLKT